MRTSLGEICTDISYGVTTSAVQHNTGTRLLRITDICINGVNWETVPGCKISEKEKRKSLLSDGDIVIARTGGTVGKSFLVKNPPEAVFASYLIRLRTKIDVALPEFIDLFLGSECYWSQLREAAQGAAQPNVNSTTLSQIELTLPPIEKQRQIAARLNAQLAEVDKARQAAETQLRDATSLKTKALETIFGGVSDKQPIGSAAKLQSGYAFKSESFRTNGIRLLRNANILPGKVYWDEAVFLNEADASRYPSYVLNDGDVLISLDRPIISSGIKVARVGSDDLPALLVQRVGRFILDPEKLEADYLYAYLQTEMFITEITGHDQSLGVPHISPTQVENIEIPLPSVTAQRELSKRLSQALYEWKTATTAIRAMLNDINLLLRKILAQAFEM